MQPECSGKLFVQQSNETIAEQDWFFLFDHLPCLPVDNQKMLVEWLVPFIFFAFWLQLFYHTTRLLITSWLTTNDMCAPRCSAVAAAALKELLMNESRKGTVFCFQSRPTRARLVVTENGISVSSRRFLTIS